LNFSVTNKGSFSDTSALYPTITVTPSFLFFATTALLTFKIKCFIGYAPIKISVSSALKVSLGRHYSVKQVMLIQASQMSFLAIPVVTPADVLKDRVFPFLKPL
jgi:hypothetical protein